MSATKKSKAQVAQEKEQFVSKIKELHPEVMSFCTGRPPQG